MSSDDDGSTSDEDNSPQEPKESYNIAALKKETTRLISRTIKKVGKVSARVRYAEEELEKLHLKVQRFQEHCLLMFQKLLKHQE